MRCVATLSCAFALCVVACGGAVSSPTGSGGGTNGSSGGSAPESGGSGGASTAGQTGGGPMFTSGLPALPIPPPPDDACAPLSEVWAHVPPAADGSACPTVSCVCDADSSTGGFFSYQTNRGCLVSLDCTAFCADTLRIDHCLDGYDLCNGDADCSPGFCVKEAGRSMGECATGANGARCRSDAQCPGGRCVAGDETGRRLCTNAKDGASCNDDADCDSMHCVLLYGSWIGSCSDRVNGSPCHIAEQDCTAGLACIGATNTSLGTCG